MNLIENYINMSKDGLNMLLIGLVVIVAVVSLIKGENV